MPRAAALFAERLHSRAQSLRAELGLSAQSFARLLDSFSSVSGGEDALEALKAEGRLLIEARTSRASTALTEADQ